MGRGKSVSAPKYRKHKATGQAVVRINGKSHYLGKHGTEESQQRYRQALADYWSPPGAVAKVTLPNRDKQTTITELAVRFAEHCKNKYGDKPEWKYQIRPVLKYIRETYGHLQAVEFGPVRFENYRQSLIEQGLSRTIVKRKANYVVRMFKLGVKYELIAVECWQRLLAVGPVEMDETKRKRRWAVANDIVVATQRELTPLLSDMVEIQKLIGARPSELCNMRPCDIVRDNEIWVYSPASHKTAHHGHSRIITIGPKAQAVLAKYLLRDPQAYCFTPREAYEQHFDQRHEERQTPIEYGNRPKPRRQQTFRPCYDHHSYRRAIQRAALRAFPIPEECSEEKEAAWREKYVWRPNQLRKSAATEARKQMDLETAQQLLGHANKRTTEQHYAEVDNERAVEFARKFG